MASKIKMYITFKLHNLEMVNKNIEECNQIMENMMEDIRINNLPILDTTDGSYIEITGDKAYLAISNKFKKNYDSDIMLKGMCDSVGWWGQTSGKLNCEPTYCLKHHPRRNDY
jgi:predicted MPP superfamily phosphohydrolase